MHTSIHRTPFGPGAPNQDAVKIKFSGALFADSANPPGGIHLCRIAGSNPAAGGHGSI